MSDFIEDDDTDIYVRLNLSFQAIKLIKSTFIPTIWEFSLELIQDSDSSVDDIATRLILQKIRHWIGNTVNGSIIFSSDNKWAKKINLLRDKNITNNLILLPYTPSDELVTRVIYAKIDTIACGIITLGTMELVSDDNNGLSYFYTGGESRLLPSITQWLGPKTFFDKPWWLRNDCSTIDVIPARGEDLNTIPYFSKPLDFAIDQRTKRSKKGNLLIPVFKPILLDGGK